MLPIAEVMGTAKAAIQVMAVVNNKTRDNLPAILHMLLHPPKTLAQTFAGGYLQRESEEM
jgi:hypothetical protein